MTNFKRHNFPFYLFISILLAAFAFFFGRAYQERSQAKRPVSTPEEISSSKDQKIQKFTLTGFDDTGKKFWNLQGESAKIDPGQTIYLDQNVTLRLRDNTVIRTDRVQWTQGGGVMKTQAPVYVDHEAVKVTGIGAIGKPSESFIQLNRKIEMIANSGSRLTCDGPMKIYYNQNKMIFYRNVKVVDERGVLTANRMDVFFDPDQKQVNQIVAIGNVTIQRGTDTTHSYKAIYSVASGSIRLEGNPEITLHKGSSALLEQGFKT